jgi:hypothetical protein
MEGPHEQQGLAPKLKPIDTGPTREQFYIHLTSRAIAARSEPELLFTMVNETMALLPYRQAALFRVGSTGSPVLTYASGLATIEETSPYTVWLNRFARAFKADQEFTRLNFDDAGESDRDGWKEWLPERLLTIPLKDKDGRVIAHAMYARDVDWSDADCSQMVHLHRVYAHCLVAAQSQNNWWKNLRYAVRRRWLALGFLAMAVVALFVPVRLSTLATAEVIALNAFSVASPQDGVVYSVAVQPNSLVKAGDLLFTLDDTSILNRYEVAAKTLAVARAELLVAEQRAFDDPRGRAALAASQGRVREKIAELASIRSLMSRVEIRADRAGVAVFSDPNDWVGKPVQTGERVMQIADPKDAGLLMWLPAKDAINLEPGAAIKVFLHTKALEPISAQLQQTSYQVVPSPDNVASYKLKATFEGVDPPPRIGLRGTARIAGERSTLGYYLFRRPLAALREWTGL